MKIDKNYKNGKFDRETELGYSIWAQAYCKCYPGYYVSDDDGFCKECNKFVEGESCVAYCSSFIYLVKGNLSTCISSCDMPYGKQK